MTTSLAPDTTTRHDESAGDALRDALVAAIGDEYEIVRLIGRGGMGAVYLARDRALERLVAIKVLPPGSATDAGVLERFRREAKTVASLQHVGIVPLYAFGERRGLVWFVMGFVRGESLASRLERDERLDSDTARTLLAQVAEALDYAHRQGVIHRDIKPDNILIDDSNGRALLTDFGIARADTMSASTNLTQVGSVLGTPHYMSPEQATAESTLDGRSDLYSVGVVGYEVVCGQRPFAGDNFRALLMQHLTTIPKPLSVVAPTVPADLGDAIMRCLEKEPAKRFPDGKSLRTAIGGEQSDDETLGYQLAELRNSVAYLVIAVVVALTGATSALVSDGTFLSLPWSVWLASPLFLLSRGIQVREARQRGYEWPTIARVMTLPPKWWIFWWPRQWRRAHDVYERLPGRLKAARLLNGASMMLLLVEIPLVIWAMAPARLAIRELAPGNHALVAVRWIASLNGLSALVALIVFLMVLTTVFTLSAWLASRVAKPFGIGKIDQRRLTIKPTDSPFWRDPRIQQIIRGSATEKKPTNPQEYVSQILTVSGTLTPATSGSGTAATAAARRLLDAITAIERELALLEKTSSREQLERFDAEIVLHESEGGDPEAISLLMNQREALVRARERMQTIAARRDDASERLDAVWADVKRLRSVADMTAANEIATRLTERCEQITADFPPRQSGARTGVQRVTAAVALTLFLGGALVAAQTAGAPLTTVRSMLERGQPDSALAVLGEAPTSSADVAILRGQAYSQHGSMKKVFGRVVDFRRAYAAFEQARALDPSRPEPLEALAWADRLAPWYVGGNSSRAVERLSELDRRAPYRAQVMRAYFDQLDERPAAAEARFRSLVTASPDSAAAWFGLGYLLSRQGRAEEALIALRRYRTLMPADRSITFHLGVVSAEHGIALADGEAALNEYLSVPEHPLYPSLDAAWWRLGQVQAKRGARDAARISFRKAIAIDGRDKDYQASLRALDDAGAAGR